MSRLKKRLFEPPITRDEFLARMKNAIWICRAFHWSQENSLRFVNSGILGFKYDANGMPLLDAAGKQLPITVSISTYRRYKIDFSEMPVVFDYLREFAMAGYTKLMLEYVVELEYLHKLSQENLQAEEPGIKRQSIIDSIVKTVMPTESAFKEMLKKLVDKGTIIPKEDAREIVIPKK